jgi:hypothetical protein
MGISEEIGACNNKETEYCFDTFAWERLFASLQPRFRQLNASSRSFNDEEKSSCRNLVLRLGTILTRRIL